VFPDIHHEQWNESRFISMPTTNQSGSFYKVSAVERRIAIPSLPNNAKFA
jgi:hypothetical protein